MKVKDLKAELANMADDAEISIQMISGCCGDYEYLNINDFYSNDPYKDFRGSFNIVLSPLRGYESCISSGAMNDLGKSLQEDREKRKSRSRKKNGKR